MSNLILQGTQPIALPEPRVKIAIRPGTLDDIAFMDGLQKKTTKQVGWMPTKQFEGKIKLGHVLVAERVDSGQSIVDSKDGSSLSTIDSGLSTRLGYLIGNDQYFKRDDVGIIYQINVVPEFRRSLVAASLLKAQFERSAYGCKLYCCWCAQDIEANRFWESMGFVALAFRTGGLNRGTKGSGTKGLREEETSASLPLVPQSLNPLVPSARIHIFWQKRIRQNDTTTPWWFPAKTDGGAIRGDRIVLPIPPGTHWSDAKPIVLPGAEENDERGTMGDEKCLPDSSFIADRSSSRSSASRREKRPPTTRRLDDSPKPKRVVLSGGMSFAPPAPVVTETVKDAPKTPRVKTPRVKKKADPTFVAAARELRDRYLDEVNAGRHLIEPTAAKYDIARTALPSTIAPTPVAPIKQLAA
jgi:hypothetical protein